MLRKEILLLENQKMFFPWVKNNFASQTQILLPRHMFPSLATMKTMLTRFQSCSLKMFASNNERTTTADREVEDFQRLEWETGVSFQGCNDF